MPGSKGLFRVQWRTQEDALCVQRGHTAVIKETTRISSVFMSLKGWFGSQYEYKSLKFAIELISTYFFNTENIYKKVMKCSSYHLSSKSHFSLRFSSVPQ